MSKYTIKSVTHFEVDAQVRARCPDPDPGNIDDWEIELEDDVICIETGCAVDDSVFMDNEELKLKFIRQWWDNYEPPSA